jgi:hypothetical protein
VAGREMRFRPVVTTLDRAGRGRAPLSHARPAGLGARGRQRSRGGLSR